MLFIATQEQDDGVRSSILTLHTAGLELSELFYSVNFRLSYWLLNPPKRLIVSGPFNVNTLKIPFHLMLKK